MCFFRAVILDGLARLILPRFLKRGLKNEKNSDHGNVADFFPGFHRVSATHDGVTATAVRATLQVSMRRERCCFQEAKGEWEIYFSQPTPLPPVMQPPNKAWTAF
jgi:hypothetical protein